MAYREYINCAKCHKRCAVSVGSGRMPPDICGPCQKEIDSKKRAAHLAKLAALPLEERVRKIEEWIYDYWPEASLFNARF